MGNQIIDRIRKLLELSKSTNEHEAAAAAARATELMRKHEIDQAVLAATAPGETPPEEIITDGIGKEQGKSTSWRVLIGQGVAAATGCRQWSAGGRMNAMGTKSAVGTWNYLCQYLAREVDRLAGERWSAPGSWETRACNTARGWKNAFRVGAAQVIRTRLIEQARSNAASKRTDVNTAAAAVIDPATGLPPSATVALAIIDRDAARVAAEYEAMAKRERFVTRKIGQVSSAGGYAAGRDAGATVNLSGGGRGLPAPAKAIRG